MGRAGSGKREKRPGASKPHESNGWVNLGEIAGLIQIMNDNRLVEIEVETASAKIRLVRERGEKAAGVPTPPGQRAPETPSLPAKKDHSRPIISPMVGTFYRAPSPDAPPFVEVGSIVEKGDTLCLIEAMKMMNEIEAEFRGRVTRVIAGNGQTVEYGEELFFLEPL